jgi:uroporphyrin-III C-methyltransferase/precorrin-2 dehydrogenase/sirohydrochlorin ferrochelatase
VTHFPIFLDLRGRRCLVVGEGEAAASRAAALARAGAAVTHVGDFRSAMLEGAVLVCVAGASAALGEAVAREAKARAIPVNVMDEPHLCGFLMPAVVERGPVTIAIGTGGTAPLLARLLREWLERALPQRLGALAALAGEFRPLVRRHIADPAARRRFWERVFTGEVARRVLAGDNAAGAALAAELDAAARRKEAA